MINEATEEEEVTEEGVSLQTLEEADYFLAAVQAVEYQLTSAGNSGGTETKRLGYQRCIGITVLKINPFLNLFLH